MLWLIAFGSFGIGLLFFIIIALFLPEKKNPIPLNPELLKFWEKSLQQKEEELILLEKIASLKVPKAAKFGKKVAKAMKNISSSHVYFIIQQAYKGKQYGEAGELMDWREAEGILDKVINE